jgi:hypothetical protein
VLQCGSRSAFPVKGVEVIMGNYIAGGEVKPVLHVINPLGSKVFLGSLRCLDMP